MHGPPTPEPVPGLAQVHRQPHVGRCVLRHFVVPTLTFKSLYCLVVLPHDRRRILDINATHHPTDGWPARQLHEAFSGDGLLPKYFHRDRDSIYGSAFRRAMSVLGITEVISAKKSPGQNPYAERVVGPIRRECTDHVIALGERHLARALQCYATYYNESRTHIALDRNSPLPRELECGAREVIAIPYLGGLHHRYTRAPGWLPVAWLEVCGRDTTY